MAVPASPPRPDADVPPARTFRWRRWIVLAVVAVIVGLAFWGAIDPYDERGYVAVPHGDHEHWVPRDRDPSVPISDFPTRPPGPDEMITPDGRIVPIR